MTITLMFTDEEITIEKDIENELSELYYKQYYQNFIDQMELLDNADRFERDDRFFGHFDDQHIQYKVKIGDMGETFLYSKDMHRAYEFLIEFDKKDTGYGIYYGCRAFVCGGNLKDEVMILSQEWETIRGEVCEILNNTFPTKDFSKRFRPTNNTNNNTFWPFWITLDPDEDIIEVAARATRLIAWVYKRYLQMAPKYYTPVVIPSDTSICTVTAFTNAARDTVYRGIRKEFGKEAESGYKKFIHLARKQENGIIQKDGRYEFAYRFVRFTLEGIAATIYLICKEYGMIRTREDGHESIPWEYFDQIFLAPDGDPLSSIRKSYSNGKYRKDFIKRPLQYLMDSGIISSKK